MIVSMRGTESASANFYAGNWRGRGVTVRRDARNTEGLGNFRNREKGCTEHGTPPRSLCDLKAPLLTQKSLAELSMHAGPSNMG